MARKQKDREYTPEKAQGSFLEYTLKGKPRKFFEEQTLRQTVSGKSGYQASAERLFGGTTPFTELIGKLSKKPTPEEKKKAKETLEKEFGVKFKDDVSRGKSEFVGIIKTLVGMKSMLKDISKNVNDVLGVSKTILSKLDELKNIKTPKNEMPSFSDLTPQTIAAGEKEYLYYEGAPENRKFYEKSKKGTAGKIASKKTQKKLMEKAAKTASKKSKEATNIPAMPTEAIEKIISQSSDSTLETVTKILSERVPAQENNIRDLLRELAKADESQEMELDEQEEMLKEAIKKALEEVLRENPDLLEQDSGGGILGTITNMLGGLGKLLGVGVGGIGKAAGGILDKVRGKTSTPDLTPKGDAKAAGKGFFSKAGGLGKMFGSGARVLGKVAAPLAVGMSLYDAYKGFTADKDASLGDKFKNAGSSALSGLTFGMLGSSPEEISAAQQKPAMAQSTPTPAAQQKPATTYSQGLAQIASASPGMRTDQIVAMNRENESLRASMSRRDAPSAPIVNNITNSMSVPIKDDKQITTSNMENTFNRLMMQDIDHPVTFSNVYMS